MTVSTLLNTLDSRELTEWQAYLNLETLEKQIKQEQMTAEERSKAILNIITKGVECQSK